MYNNYSFCKKIKYILDYFLNWLSSLMTGSLHCAEDKMQPGIGEPADEPFDCTRWPSSPATGPTCGADHLSMDAIWISSFAYSGLCQHPFTRAHRVLYVQDHGHQAYC